MITQLVYYMVEATEFFYEPVNFWSKEKAEKFIEKHKSRGAQRILKVVVEFSDDEEI